LAGQCFISPRRSFPEASFSPGRKLALEKANHIRDELLRLIVLTTHSGAARQERRASLCQGARVNARQRRAGVWIQDFASPLI
jgi:hypothetical protein